MRTYAPSLWLAPEAVAPSLSADRRCDVVVVGGGYTGLSAATAAARAGADVVLLERAHVGFGASGRNAGHLTPTIGKDLTSLLRVYGREVGGALARLAEAAVGHVEDALTDERIDCDYVAGGNVVAGIHPGQERSLNAAAAAGAALGASVEMLSPAELDERGLPAFVACGYLERRGGVLDPGRYVRGLRRVAATAGTQLFEQTPVVEIEEHSRGVHVHTPGGVVSADACVVATNAYSHGLGLLGSAFAPIVVSQLATVPLTDEQRERIGWQRGEGIYTAHESLENFRLTADGRLVCGSRYIRYGYRSRLPADESPRTFARIERILRTRFPELTDVAVDGFWSGPIAVPLTFLPFIGRLGRSGRIVTSAGYAGHGVALASLLGSRAGAIAVGEAEPPITLSERRRLPLPPEPLRSLAVHATVAGMSAIDARTDRQAQPRRSLTPASR